MKLVTAEDSGKVNVIDMRKVNESSLLIVRQAILTLFSKVKETQH